MAAGERERRELQEALVGTIGPDPTDTLLGYLPPVGWADVATKRDLDALESRIGGKIDRLAGRIDGLEGRIDGRIDGLEGRINGRIDGLEGRINGLVGRIDGLDGRIDGLDGKIDALAGRLEGRLHHELHKQDRWLLGMTITIVFALFAQTLALIGQHFFG